MAKNIKEQIIHEVIGYLDTVRERDYKKYKRFWKDNRCVYECDRTGYEELEQCYYCDVTVCSNHSTFIYPNPDHVMSVPVCDKCRYYPGPPK